MILITAEHMGLAQRPSGRAKNHVIENTSGFFRVFGNQQSQLFSSSSNLSLDGRKFLLRLTAIRSGRGGCIAQFFATA